MFLRGLNVNVNYQTAQARWNNSENNGLQEISNLFYIYADTLSRLTIVNPPNSINMLLDVPTHPIHLLYANENLERKFSQYFKIAFDEDLILNRGAGSILPIHVGNNPVIIDIKNDRVSNKYLDELRKLPLVNEQGDGIKSFVGCLLTTLVTKKFITLIDEPEAFLHPPQARFIGSLLAKEHTNNQLIIATHSGDVLRGLLDINSKKLNILRLTRNKEINHISNLNEQDIKIFWSDPILRFSNLLDGLFHEAVIITEADSDCRFYSAILTALFDGSDGDEPKKQPDFFLLHQVENLVSRLY